MFIIEVVAMNFSLNRMNVNTAQEFADILEKVIKGGNEINCKKY
ncbi:hypothetical protein [Bacillus toyonensis]|nr:hypothetical protein [Bacillus toyonensis]